MRTTGPGGSACHATEPSTAAGVCGTAGLARAVGRRAFVGGLGLGTLAMARAGFGQTAQRPYRIGSLSYLAPAADYAGPEPPSPYVRALLEGLHALGYVYGNHYVTEVRSAEGDAARFVEIASELARLPVDVIVATGPLLPAVKQATSTIPVVMIGAADPVVDGFAQSLRRPGGNFTGLSFQLVESTGKRLELIKELVPGAAPVAVLWSRYDGPRPARTWQATEAAARERRWKLISLEIRDGGEIERAFKTAAAARAGALLVHPTGVLDPHAEKIAGLAAQHRLPAVYGARHYVEKGGLMLYSPNLVEQFRRAAAFVVKIAKGARPGDLPIEQPTAFDFVINREAARRIRLTIPPAMLSRATELVG